MTSKDQTVITVLDKIRQIYPDRDAYISYNEDLEKNSLSFQELWTLSSRFAYILKEEGLQRNDVVLVCVPLCLESIIVCFGVILAGGNVTCSAKVYAGGLLMLETIKMCQIRFLIINGEEDFPLCKDAKILYPKSYVTSISRSDAPTLSTIIRCCRKCNKGEISLMELLQATEDEFVDFGIKPSDGAAIPASFNPDNVHQAKLCDMSHGALVSQSRAWAKRFPEITKLCMPFQWYVAVALPFDTLNGWTRVIPDLWVPLKNTHPFDFEMKLIEEESAKAAFVSPYVVSHVLEKREGQTGKLDVLLTGGMPMNRAIYQSLQQFAETTYVMYVSTEGAVISINVFGQKDEFTAFDCGEVLENTEIRVLNDSLEDVQGGESGQIVTKSPSLFTRYAGEPERTKKAFIQDGWFLTGDSGYIRSDGHLIVYGRSGDVISRGITLISPSWLEQPISEHTDVMEVSVVPVPDTVHVQNTCACVVKRPGSNLTSEDVIELVTKCFGEDGNTYFVLDYVLFFEKALPRLTRGKLGELATERLGLGDKAS